MPTAITLRLRCAAAAFVAESLHLAWEATHGGIATHHLLQRADLPGVSNAWGLLLLPALAAWAASRWPSGPAERRTVALGFALPLLLGAALSLAFRWQWQAATEALFFGMLALAVLLPACRRESLVGFVLGMSWTFGAMLPTFIGAVLAALSWLVHGLLRLVWRRLRRA